MPAGGSLRERFFQLYGERPDLVEVRKDAGGLQIEGYVAALGDQGPTRGPQNVFVNRRIVKDRTIAHAIIEAYSVATIKERSPEVHLFLEMPRDRVDVNVHPTKAEVRFLRTVAGPRGPAPRARRRARAGHGAGAAVPRSSSAPRRRRHADDHVHSRASSPGAPVGNRWARLEPDRRLAGSPIRGR